jgi:hypothetical protein
MYKNIIKTLVCFIVLGVGMYALFNDAFKNDIADLDNEQARIDYLYLGEEICEMALFAVQPLEALSSLISHRIEEIESLSEASTADVVKKLNKHHHLLGCFGRPFTFYSIDNGSYPVVLEQLILNAYTEGLEEPFDVNYVFLVSHVGEDTAKPMTLLDYLDETLLNPEHNLYDPSIQASVTALRARLVEELNALNYGALSHVVTPVNLRALPAANPKWRKATAIDLTKQLTAYSSPRHVFHGLQLLKQENSAFMNDIRDSEAYRPDDFYFGLAVSDMLQTIPSDFDDSPACEDYLSLRLNGHRASRLEELDELEQYFYFLYQGACGER